MSDELDLDDELAGIFDSGDDEVPPSFGDDDSPADLASIEASKQNLKRLSYQWAEDVFWVYQNLSSKVSKDAAGHRWHMLKTARENTERFQEQTLPKAMLLLDKMLDKDGDDEIIEIEETQSIKAMKVILRDAIKEALGEDE